MEINNPFLSLFRMIFSLGILVIAVLFFQDVKAGPLHEIFGSGVPAYHKHINKKFLEFYEKNFFDFSKKMDIDDYAFLSKCIDQISMWSRHLPDGSATNQDGTFPLSPLKISLSLKNKKVSYGKVAIACPQGNAADFKDFQKIAKKYNINLPRELSEKNYFWFEWDLDNKTQAIYYFKDYQLINDIYEKGRQVKTLSYSSSSLELLRDKYALMASSLYAGLQSNQDTFWIELKAFDSRMVDEKVRMDLYKILNETGMMADSMELVSAETATFFYP